MVQISNFIQIKPPYSTTSFSMFTCPYYCWLIPRIRYVFHPLSICGSSFGTSAAISLIPSHPRQDHLAFFSIQRLCVPHVYRSTGVSVLRCVPGNPIKEYHLNSATIWDKRCMLRRKRGLYTTAVHVAMCCTQAGQPGNAKKQTVKSFLLCIGTSGASPLGWGVLSVNGYVI